MSTNQDGADAEFEAMQTAFTTLQGLDDDARRRVLDYVIARLGLHGVGVSKARQSAAKEHNDDDANDVQESDAPSTFGNFAELYDATQPKSNADKALVAGYWRQVCEGAENFDSQSANTALKHLGEGLANVTGALETLKNQKPALALQLKKAGKSRQARKTYKITVAGVRAVEALMNG